MISPNGFSCLFASAISASFSFGHGIAFDDSTIRFDIRATGSRPGAERPWPFDCGGTPWTGARDIRNVLSTPFSTRTVFWPGTPWSSKR